MQLTITFKSFIRLIKHPIFVFSSIVFLLANSSSHPVLSSGFTGAPGDGFCTNCHSGNPNFDGTMSIDGVPATITTGQVYQITVTVENPNGLANRAGFQILALNASNTNAGAMAGASASSSIKTLGTKNYFGHAPAVAFAGAPLTWTVNWTAPTTGTGDITFYGTSILGNGSGQGGDKMLVTNSSGTLSGGSTPLSATLSNVTNVSCNGGSDGSAMANPVGGTAAYTYLWTSGENTQTASSLPAGLAKVTVTDNVGTTTVAQTTITQPTAVVVNVNSQVNPTCFNSANGTITVAGSGGTPGYIYDWSNGASGASITGLNAGNYTVTVTDNNNCEKTKIVTLTAPPAIVITAAFNTNPTCLGQSNGSISLQVSGGAGTLDYLWTNGATTSTINNLAAGSYTVSITDDNNCQLVQSYTLAPGAALNVNTSFTNATCNGGSNGSATATPVGAGTYTYLWTNGGTTQTISNIPAGVYTVTVTNSNQCSKTSQITVSQPAALSSTQSVTNASCPGIPNGAATISVSGGTSPYTYLWSNGVATSTISNVVAGTYSVVVTDNKSCTYNANVVIGANQSALLSIASSVTPTCFGGTNGSINIAAVNAAGYNITWSNGATGTAVSNLAAGTFTAMATNPNGCQSNQLQVVLTQPTIIAPTADTIIKVKCFGQSNGSIATTFGGGTGALTFLWSNGSTNSSINTLPAGAYSLSVTDANTCQVVKSYMLTNPALLKLDSSIIVNPFCFGSNGSVTIYPSGGTGALTTNWSNGSTGVVLQNVAAGSYTSTTLDENGCISTNNFTVTSPLIIADNPTVVNETVTGASNVSITLMPSGGAGSYTYLWSNGKTTSSINGLSPGVYNVNLTDGNNCTKTFSYNVQSGGCALAVTYVSKNVSCFNGSDGNININASNGTPPYLTNIPVTNLKAGEYNFLVTDAAGCTFTISNVVITQPSALNIKLDTVINASSATSPNGVAKISVTGGVSPPYNYQWKNAIGVVVSTVEDPINLLPNTYTVTVLDANGCVIEIKNITVGFTSSIADELVKQIAIYPNPIELGFLNISMPFNGVQIVLLDTNGKKISGVTQKQNIEQIDVTNLKAGIYLLKIKIEDTILLKTFIKI